MQMQTHTDTHRHMHTCRRTQMHTDEHKTNCIQCVGGCNIKTCPDIRRLFNNFRACAQPIYLYQKAHIYCPLGCGCNGVHLCYRVGYPFHESLKWNSGVCGAFLSNWLCIHMSYSSSWQLDPSAPFQPPEHLRTAINEFEATEVPSIGLMPRPLSTPAATTGGTSWKDVVTSSTPSTTSSEDFEFIYSYVVFMWYRTLTITQLSHCHSNIFGNTIFVFQCTCKTEDVRSF